MELAVSVVVYIACSVFGLLLGRLEGRPRRGLLYALLLGPIGLLLFWVGRDWRRKKDWQRATANHHAHTDGR